MYFQAREDIYFRCRVILQLECLCYEVKSWTKCLSRRFVFSFRRFVVWLPCFVSSSLLQFRLVVAPFRRVLVSIRHFSRRFVTSMFRFVVSLCHFLASFRRPSCNFVLSLPRFVVSLFRFVTSLVVSSLRCFVSSLSFTVSFRAGLGTSKGTIRMYVTWRGYCGLPKMTNLSRSEELRTYLRQNIEYIVNHVT